MLPKITSCNLQLLSEDLTNIYTFFSSTMHPGMASSTKHHEGPCGPCVLCSAKAIKYTHSEKMTEAEIALINKFQKRDIYQACICLPCAKQVKRNVSNPNFHP